MGAAWTLALRDLRGGLHGLRLLFLCLLLGIATLAGIGSLSSALLAGIGERGQSLLGGDIELRLTHRVATPDERAALARLGRVSETARMNAMVASPDGAKASLGEMKAVDEGYPLYGSFDLQGGSDLQASLRNQGVVMDPLLAERLGVKSGDTVRIGAQRFTLRGVIAYEPDRAGQGFELGPSVLISKRDLAATGLVSPGSLVRYHYRIVYPGDPQPAIDRLNAAFPDAGWQINDRRNGAPGLSTFIEDLTQFMTLVGLTALMVAGVGVGNGVSAYLDTKVRTIATLKSLGADSGLIFRVYLLQVLLVAMAATVLGLVLGAVAPFGIVSVIGDALPVPPRMGLYPTPLLVAALQGLMIALVFALWPLAQARVTPAARLFRARVETDRQVGKAIPALIALLALAVVALAVLSAADRLLALGFAGAAFGVLLLLRVIGWGAIRLARAVPRPANPTFRMAIANLHRPGAATPQVVMALGLGLTLFATLAVVEANMRAQVDRTLPRTAPDFFFIDIPKADIDRFTAQIQAIPGLKAVDVVPSLRGPITKVNGVPARDVKAPPEAAWALRGDRGLTYTATLPEGNKVVSGAWWPADYRGPPAISLDDRIAKGLGLKVGDTLTVSVLGVEVTAQIANTRLVDWEALGFNFVMLFAPGTLESAPHTYMATVDVPPAQEASVFREIARDFPSVATVRMSSVFTQLGGLLTQIGAAVRGMASVTLMSGILVLVGAVVAGRQARSYDSVILKVLGATRRQVLSILVCEYALLGLATALVAMVLGLAGGWFVTTEILDFKWQLPLGLLVATVTIGTLATIGFGLAGAWSVLSARPNAALRSA